MPHFSFTYPGDEHPVVNRALDKIALSLTDAVRLGLRLILNAEEEELKEAASDLVELEGGRPKRGSPRKNRYRTTVNIPENEEHLIALAYEQIGKACGLLECSRSYLFRFGIRLVIATPLSKLQEIEKDMMKRKRGRQVENKKVVKREESKRIKS